MIISLIALSALNSEPVLEASKERHQKYAPTTKTIAVVAEKPAIQAARERAKKFHKIHDGINEAPVIQVARELARK